MKILPNGTLLEGSFSPDFAGKTESAATWACFMISPETNVNLNLNLTAVLVDHFTAKTPSCSSTPMSTSHLPLGAGPQSSRQPFQLGSQQSRTPFQHTALHTSPLPIQQPHSLRLRFLQSREPHHLRNSVDTNRNIM